MQEATDYNAEGSVDQEMRSGSEIEMRAKARTETETNADDGTTETNNPEKRLKKQKKIPSGRPSLSRSMSGVFNGKLKRLSMSTPSSPVLEHSFEMTPNDPVDHGAKRKSKKPPRSPKQPKGQDEEDGEQKKRSYFGIFKKSSKKQRVSTTVGSVIMYHFQNVFPRSANISEIFRSRSDQCSDEDICIQRWRRQT